jgi:hypothetical protein
VFRIDASATLVVMLTDSETSIVRAMIVRCEVIVGTVSVGGEVATGSAIAGSEVAVGGVVAYSNNVIHIDALSPFDWADVGTIRPRETWPALNTKVMITGPPAP